MEAYDVFRWYRDQILEASAVLAGEEVGPSGESWQEVAVRLATVCRGYAAALDTASRGGFYGPIVFPSWAEAFGECELPKATLDRLERCGIGGCELLEVFESASWALTKARQRVGDYLDLNDEYLDELEAKVHRFMNDEGEEGGAE